MMIFASTRMTLEAYLLQMDPFGSEINAACNPSMADYEAKLAARFHLTVKDFI